MNDATGTATNPTEAATSQESATTAATTPVSTDTTQQATSAITLLGEAKPAEGEQKPAEDGTKPAEQAKPEGAPEKYEFTAPEGKEYDPQVIEKFAAAAKDANLTQDAAQKLLDQVAPALAERQTQQAEAIRSEWLESSKSDKEFGGEKIQENMAVAKKALDTFGTPELRTLLENTGLGNHPEVIRAFYRAGKAISEDTFVGGQQAPKANLNAASVLYDNTRKE